LSLLQASEEDLDWIDRSMEMGSPGQHDLVYAQLQAETRAPKAQALARGEALPEDLPDSGAVRVIRTLVSSLIALLVVGGTVWLSGGDPATVTAAVVATVVALVLISRWRKSRTD